MADAELVSELHDEEPEAPVALRKPVEDEVEMDITPMIDIVFLLLIFFIVCSTAASQVAVELPPARHGKGVGEQTSVVLTVEPGGTETATVYLGDTSGTPLPGNAELQEAEIVAAVEAGIAQGKTNVLVKAAKDVKYREIDRVGKAVGRVEGVKLHMAVMEKE